MAWGYKQGFQEATEGGGGTPRKEEHTEDSLKPIADLAVLPKLNTGLTWDPAMLS